MTLFLKNKPSVLDFLSLRLLLNFSWLIFVITDNGLIYEISYIIECNVFCYAFELCFIDNDNGNEIWKIHAMRENVACVVAMLSGNEKRIVYTLRGRLLTMILVNGK